MNRKRGFKERIVACFMAALMVVGVVPLDFAGMGVQEAKADGALKALNAGESYSYDFNANQALFGETAVSANGTEIYSENNILKASYKSTSNGLLFNNGHGLQFAGELTITALVPANTVGIFTVPLCKYSNAPNATAVIKVNDEQKGNAVSLNKQHNVSDTETETLSYINNTSDTVEVNLVLDGAGKEIYVHNIKYNVSKPLNTLNVGDEPYSYDFNANQALFGETTVSNDGTEIYSENNILKAAYKSASNGLSFNNGHGLQFAGELTITALVPANTVGTFTVPLCKYLNSSSATAVIKVDGEQKCDKVALNKQHNVSDIETEMLSYINNTSDAVEVNLVLDGAGGTIYLHNIKYEVSDIPSEVYPVTVTFADGYQLADVTDDNLVYNFTKDGQTTTYKPSQIKNNEVKLPAGTYTLSLSGTEIEEIPYDLTDSCKTIEVNENGGSVNVELARIAKWLFGNKNGGFDKEINGKEGLYKGLKINAKNGGKLSATADARTDNAQLNAGTIISVPVGEPSVITVKTKNKGTVKVNGTLSNDSEFKYTYVSDGGNVNIEAVSNDYIYYIKLESYTGSSITASGTVTQQNTLPEGTQIVFKNRSDESQIYYADIVDGKYSVKLPATDSEVEFELLLSNSEYGIKGTDSIKVKAGADVSSDITCVQKIPRKITLQLGSGPDLSNVTYVFTRNDDGTEYKFANADKDNIELYDGTYRVTIEGDTFHKEQAYRITSDMELVVDGADTSHVMTFEKAASWNFAGKTGDKGDYYTLALQKASGYYDGLEIDASATNAKLSARLSNGDTQATSGTIIKVPVTGACMVNVTTTGTDYSPLIKVGDVQGTKNDTNTSYAYKGGAGYVTVEITGDKASAYLLSISVVYAGDSSVDVEQSVMPSVPDVSVPKGNTASNIAVDADGQRLNIKQTGGDYGSSAGISYYVFPATTDKHVLEFDAVVTEATNKSSYGLFGGVFTDNYQYTIAMRSASTSVRAVYSKSIETFSSASGAEYGITLGTKVHYNITTDNGKAVITASFVDKDGVSQICTLSQTMAADGDGKVYYGVALANTSATITNMTYKSSDGSAVYYKQNNAYRPAGKAPEATSINAVTTTGTDTSDAINVTWTGDLAENDGYYELQVQIDNGAWTTVAEDIVDLSYIYKLEPASKKSYRFRVYGVLGKPELGGTKSASSATTDKALKVTGALATPVVTATGDSSSITLKWDKDNDATSYEIYRYSFDEGESKAKKIKTQAENIFVDKDVTAEMPYYYYVISKSKTNSSAASKTVWAMASAGHSGKYVYENEATEIFITNKSYDTVLNGKALLEGNVYGEGTLRAEIAGAEKKSVTLKTGDAFSFELDLEQGRNDVNLLFTDANGKVTRKTYNFVYLTKYDKLVDASYKGTDGTANADGIPTYKTIQAAVNSVASGNANKVVIFVAAGNYEERLIVDKPNVSIIGQDRESTLVHYYPGILGTKYEAGGDMEKRCATYIQSSATNFNAENISFKNDYDYSTPDGKGNKSADALRCDADGAVFVNTKMSGVQDTLYMHSGTQFYYKCRIEGLIDFVYSGDAARSFFDDCELVFVYQSTKNSGYVCAPKTAKEAPYGLTFYNCTVTGEEGCNGTGYLLARPWGKDAYITWINCYMGKSVNATLPYSEMSGNAYEDARFFEYGSYGPGYAVNSDRRQISTSRATELINAIPYGVNISNASNFVGNVRTTCVKDGYATSTRIDDKYNQTDGDDKGLGKYTSEGYASAYGVTGGGLLKETSDNYYKVSDAEGFLNALVSAKKSGKASVIELTADINLGSREVTNYSAYSDVIKPYSAQALTHPTLIASGVSILTLNNVYNLTIFSSNASSIKHANITMKNSGNIIIRNIKFDELWEWDEDTAGDYDRNDWDYMTIDSGSNGIWVDHCTFFKAYDGVIDIKNPNPVENVTISWCEFLPGSEDDIFFNKMMDTMAANSSAYPYYKSLLDKGMTQKQIWWYAYGQKKTHLLGQSAEATNAAGIRATFANNYYKNSMDRMPRLRYGVAHVYNCIMDAQDLYTARASITDSDAAKHIVSNGASSTCDGQLLVENSYINGITNALNSGNGSDPSGYINAVNSLYYINGVRYKLEPKVNTSLAGEALKKTNVSEFKSALGYSYNLRDAATLSSTVVPYSGAGKLTLTILQWEKSTYNDKYVSDGSTGSYDNAGLPDAPKGDNTSNSGGNISDSGNTNKPGSDTSDNDDNYYDDDSSDDTISNDSASGSVGNTGSEADNVLGAADIPGASITQIGGKEFTQMGEISEGAAKIISSIDANGQITTGDAVLGTTETVTSTVIDKITNGKASNIAVFASQDASVSAEVINKLKETGKTLSIGVVDDNGKVNAIVTLDGSKLGNASSDFTLKITVDVKSNTVSKAASNAGIASDKYNVIDFNYSGKLPGTFKVAVNVAGKFADGTQLALYYNNESAGQLENQYQVTTVTGGFAEFAIDHCSQYVLVDVAAARSMITTSTIASPKTADAGHIVLWIMLMGAAAAAYFGIKASKADEKKRA